MSYSEWRVHANVGRAVDALLAGGQPPTQVQSVRTAVVRFVPNARCCHDIVHTNECCCRASCMICQRGLHNSIRLRPV